MHAADRESMRDFVDVGLVDPFAFELFFEVIDSQRHNREPIGRRTWRLCIEFRGEAWSNTATFEIGCDPVIDFLDPIVAGLVVLIDVAFDRSDLRIRHIG